MISKIKKPVSILLVFMMIVSLFAMVPVTASAAEYYGAYDAYDSNSINELKQGDQISGHYDPTETEYLEADYVTIVDYNTGDKIASRVLEWTADKDYEIKQKAQNDISGDFEDSFDSAFVYEYVFTVSEAKPKYTVTWKNGDTVLKTDTVEEGTTPTYDGTPEKAEDENYTYTFAGWTPEITAVTGDVTYTATFTATAKTKPWPSSNTITTGGEYTCPSTLSRNTIVSGGTEENPVIINITGQTTVQAPIFLRSGYLKIVGNNNTVEANRGFVYFTGSGSYKPNGDAHLTITDLSLSSTNASNQYIQIISYANFQCQSTFENVTFKNCNSNGSGAVVIGSETTHTLKNCTFEDNTGYNAGGISFRNGSDVTMEGCTFKNCTRTRSYSTSFLGGGAVWLESDTKLTLDGCTFENCTGECGAVGIVSTATLTLKGNTTITGNSSGNLYLPTGATFNVAEDFTGTVGVTTQTAPTDSASVLLAIELADTQATLANNNIVSDNENYGVIYKDNSLLLINSKVYTVTWQNDDGTVLKTEALAEGTTPTYDGTTPEKAEDENYTYTFAGWSPEITAVTGNVTYTAQFDATPKTPAATASYVKVTTAPDDWSGDYLIVFEDEEGNKAFNGSADGLNSSGNYIDVTISGGEIASDAATDAAKVTIAQIDGGYSIATATGAYIGGVSGQNKLASSDDAIVNTISLDNDGNAEIVSNNTYLRFNTSWSGFRYYKTASQRPVQLYKLTGGSAPAGETITLDLNQDNATVIWYDATDSDGYWSMEAAYNDGCYLVLKGNSNQPAGTYEWADMGSGCEIIDYEASQNIYFVDGSCTVTVNEDVVTVSGTFTGSDRNTYVVTVTYEAPYYTITDESVNGAVTADVNGAEVTKAKAGKTVLLNVAPADGYQLKSITASAQKTNPEDFGDLVALMGDAVFGGDENYDCGGYTCKVEDGKFVVYNGTTLVTELSESNMTGFNGDSDYCVEVNSNNVVWNFYVENGEITGIDVMDADEDYDIIFSAVSGSKSTGTLQPVQVDLTTVTEGSQYSFTMPAKNVTVKAEFEEAPAPIEIFTKHSITLGGDIGVNFYIDSAAADFANASTAVVKFTWDGGGEDRTKEVNLKELTPDADGYYKATVDVVAAHMAHEIHAEVYLNGEKLDQTDDYSVQDYAETVYANPEKYDSEKPDELKALAKALLNYGAMAQTVFYNSLKEHPDLANTTVGYNGYEGVTADQIEGAINGEASDLNAIAEQLGAKYYTNSLIYLSKNTLRIYFTPTSYPGEIPNAGAYDGNLSGYYYYVDHANIPAAELDNQQTFTVGGITFTFSALDYAYAVVESTKMEPEQQNLAKALYLYNQKANAYFDAAPAPVHTHTPGEAVQENVVPASCTAAGSYDEVVYCSECHEELSRETKTIDMLAHTIVAVAEVPATTEADGVAAHYECSVCHKLFSDAEGNNETTAEALVIPQIVENVVDLGTLQGDYEAQNNDVLTGTLSGNKKITIADGATVTLRNANITLNDDAYYAGITPLGDATILLEGANTVKGGYEDNPGIFVPENTTLTIDGTGSLTASSGGDDEDRYGCGIGGGFQMAAGNIVINGGTITANGGDWAAGIGSGDSVSCGNITITGGTITANGGEYAAGIGSGYDEATCSNILITGGTITANGGQNSAGIGSGAYSASCGNIMIADTVTLVTATKGSNAPNSIGAGYRASCGTVTIEDGANVIQN